MDTRKVTANYRLSEWAKVIQARVESGQSVKDFCQTTGIKRNAYYYWQRKLRTLAYEELVKEEGSTNIVPSGWAQFKPLQEQYASDSIDVKVNGCLITVNADTNSELLKKVCLLLRSL